MMKIKCVCIIHKATPTSTRPSILCVTHQMNHKRRNYSAVPYEMMNYKWYQQVLGQYKAILSGTWWYWVSKNWHCLVFHGTASAKGLFACIYWKKWRFGRVLPMPDILTHRHQN